MTMFYFSGTGNSKFVAEVFAKEMNAECYSIENKVDFAKLINESDTVAFCYPVYMSRVPRIVREFAFKYFNELKGKRIIIFCTQFLLSGDGARAFSDLFLKGHIKVIYAEHFFMPNNVNNVGILAKPKAKTIEKCMQKSIQKVKKVCENIRHGRIKKRGFNIVGRALGLPQGIFMNPTERIANKSVRIGDECNLCGFCEKICPTKNLLIENSKVMHKNNCTMCYRCINKCPKKAINVVFKGKVKWQYEGIN